MTTPLREEIAALPKEELLELRRRIKAALPREWQMAMLSGREEDRIPQEEYDKFVHTQLKLYKAEKEPAAQIPG
jgi:hypothetical protein